MNLSFSFPSETPGALVDIKKGRSTISFTRSELFFLSDLTELLQHPDVKATPKVTPVEVDASFEPALV